MSRIQSVVAQMQTVRGYTENLLAQVDEADWFRSVEGGVTHIAWQVGHIAVAEHFLAMRRIRGRDQADEELIPKSFQELFKKGSNGNPAPNACPSTAEIRDVFDRVHSQAIRELEGVSEEVLDEVTKPPHPMFKTKLGALLWAPQHEMLHAGQIGLLRRLFGHPPVR